MKRKTIDILVLLFLLVIAVFYAILTKDIFIGRSLFIVFIFTVIPAIYLGIREKKNWKKIAVATITFGTIFGFIFEFIAEYNLAYSVVSVVSEFKILGVLPVDNILGHMMMTLFTIVFYVHFIDREVNKNISKRIILALLPAALAIAFILLAFNFQPNLIELSRPYLFMGLAAIVPTLLLGIRRPGHIKNMLKTAIYFFFLYLVIEILAVKFNYWIYPGDNYVGWVTIFDVSFPFEELFFWMMFYAATLVAYYEIFIDINTKKTLL